MDNILKSKKIYLREMEEKDWVDVHKYASKEKVCKYQVWGPNTKTESENFVRQSISDANQKIRSRFVFAIILKENGNMIGTGEINIRNFTNKVGEVGYIINPEYWGLGFATETAKILIDFGFNQLKLHRIFATCDPKNIASSRVLEKVGMFKEGRMRENLFIKTGWRDSFIYSVLEQEWNQK